jgi:Pro-kumamolisin, activation domain/Bacterial Ig-like domain (group 3)
MGMTFIPASWRKLSSLMLLPGCLASFGSAHTPAPIETVRPLITQVINENALVRLKGTVHPLATPDADQGAVPDSMQLGRTILVLKSSDTTQVALKKFLDDQQNSKSPTYHHWLKPEEFGLRFGAAPQDIQRITQWLESHGLQVEAPTLGRNLVIFSGTQAQFKNAFHTEIHHYLVQGETYSANANDPQIPAALAPIVSGFSSLNNFPRRALHTQPQLMRHDGSSWKAAAAANEVQPSFTTVNQGKTYHVVAPYDLATIYNIKSLWDAGIDGTGQTIAIVSDSDINPADIDYFRTTFGLPAKKLNVLYYGANPGMNGDESEADLDVQWAGAVAKNATIDLVVAANSSTSGGIDGAAAYIINNNLASILNVSYGACEFLLRTAGNQYYNQIWQQAAAQGITVVVASGDSGSAVCDRAVPDAFFGLAVSGIASTPYNVAVGGTDFHSSYLAPNTYWNTTNDPITLASVKSYLPETTWNDSCASPDVLAAVQTKGGTDATPEALCNDANETQFLSIVAGSGGQSDCAVTGIDASIPCVSGIPKPAWQSGVAGIPLDGVRDLPDVSLMAGNGIWSSFYVYCQSDVLPSGTCDVNNAIQGAGGTSFASPVFAAILALVQQKTASQQGNVNYTLYKLAAAQYSGPAAASCTSSGAVAGNACMFYDITDGTIAVPCANGSRNCASSIAADTIGILPGFSANSGYDLATGLGSVNAYNLVEGWSSASTQFLPTTTTITATGAATAIYGSGLKVSVSVAANTSASGIPSGDVGLTSNSATPGAISAGETTLTNGQGVVAVGLLPVGAHQLFARYAGDASFAPSLSNGLSVTIGKANLSAALAATRTIISQGQKVTLSVSASGVPNGANPTGTVIIANATTGAAFGTLALASSYSSSSTPVSLAYVTVSSSDLEFGTDSIIATYSGDNNYNAAYVTALGVTLGGSFTTSISPAILTLGPNASGSVTVTVTPKGTTVLIPSALTFSCPPTLPAGFTCSFSEPISGGNGVIISTMTLQLASPLYTPQSTITTSRTINGGRAQAGVLVSVAGLMILALPGRRRRLVPALTVLVLVPFFIVTGCGGNHSPNSVATLPSLISTTTTLSASPTAPTLGSPIVLASKVTPGTGTGVPTGSITFSDGSTSLGVVNLESGAANLTVNSLPAGVQTIVATYSGDSAFTSSASSASQVDVTFTTTITVTVADIAGDKSGAGLAVSVQ